ncbi:MAG: rhodanese-like domain-containing protein [Pseudomonadota bacterium]
MFQKLKDAVTKMASSPSFAEISPQVAHDRVTAGYTLLVDVREPHEWRDTGLPSASAPIALQDPDFLDKVLALADGDKAKPIAVSCKSGMRGQKAAHLLRAAGFDAVSNVRGGFQSWADDRLPIEAYH